MHFSQFYILLKLPSRQLSHGSALKQQPFASLRQQQFTRWVGLFVLVALVMDLLMPALVSRLQALSPDSMFLETCSAAGFVKRDAPLPSQRMAGITASTGGQGPSDQIPAKANHCVLCAVGQAWLPPSDFKLEVRTLVVNEPLPVVGTSLPTVQRFPWATLPARAPPALA